MKEIKRLWDILTKAERQTSIEEIIRYFDNERDEEIGVIAGEEVLDFFLEKIAPYAYNRGVEDSKNILRSKFNDLEVDLDMQMRSK